MQARFKLGEEAAHPRTLIPLVERAIVLDPDYADAHLVLGRLYFELGENHFELPEPNIRAAQGCVQKALLLNSNLSGCTSSSTARSFRTSIRIWGAAADSWKQADKLRGYPLRYNRLCLAGYYERAERACRQCIERDPLNTHPRIWLARALDRLGRIDDAAFEYKEALALVPRSFGLFSDFVEHWLEFARDVERARQFLDETEYSGGALFWARARIAHAQGDDNPLRSLVERWVSERETRYVSAQIIEHEYYRLGDIGAHLRWFAMRAQEQCNLYFVPTFMLRDRPDYWERLSDWAIDDSAQVRSRMRLLNEHRARIDRITEKMVLPHDYVE